MKSKAARSGFTLAELMIVVVIIGILSSIAMVKYADLLRKSNEGNVYGNLGAMRSALSIYYADLDGQFPSSLGVLTVSARYIKTFPEIRVPNYHAKTAAVAEGAVRADTNGWGYNNVSANSNFGALWIDCTHTDSKGSAWTAY